MKYGMHYVCKRYRLLSFLKAKGFLPSMTLPDRDNPKFNIWIFDNSPELEAAIDEYIAQNIARQEAQA